MFACLTVVFIEKEEEGEEGRREGKVWGGGEHSQILAEHLNIIIHKSFGHTPHMKNTM